METEDEFLIDSKYFSIKTHNILPKAKSKFTLLKSKIPLPILINETTLIHLFLTSDLNEDLPPNMQNGKYIFNKVYGKYMLMINEQNIFDIATIPYKTFKMKEMKQRHIILPKDFKNVSNIGFFIIIKKGYLEIVISKTIDDTYQTKKMQVKYENALENRFQHLIEEHQVQFYQMPNFSDIVENVEVHSFILSSDTKINY